PRRASVPASPLLNRARDGPVPPVLRRGRRGAGALSHVHLPGRAAHERRRRGDVDARRGPLRVEVPPARRLGGGRRGRVRDSGPGPAGRLPRDLSPAPRAPPAVADPGALCGRRFAARGFPAGLEPGGVWKRARERIHAGGNPSFPGLPGPAGALREVAARSSLSARPDRLDFRSRGPARPPPRPAPSRSLVPRLLLFLLLLGRGRIVDVHALPPSGNSGAHLGGAADGPRRPGGPAGRGREGLGGGRGGSGAWLRRGLAALALVVVLVSEQWWIVRLGVLGIAEGEKIYAEASHFAERNVPSGSFVVAMQMSGALRYYTGLLPVRWDWLQPQTAAILREHARARGRALYALVAPFEVDKFQERLPGAWSK